MAKQPMKILVIDDEEAMREVLSERLGGWGFDVVTAADGGEAQRLLRAEHPAVVITDVVLPDVSGIDLLKLIRSEGRGRPVILITAHGTVDLAVTAMKEGATDFLTKPLDYERLEEILERVASAFAPPAGRARKGLGDLVGRSRAMREVYALIEEVAATDVAVLLTGESGTGKEVVARTIHALGRRAEGPFVAVNCAAIPSELMESEIFGHEKGSFTGATGTRQGCFELASGGTLFLDEISEMPAALQPKLLRVLEDRRVRRLGARSEIRVDTRQLAATNRDPEEAVKQGVLREDLYYRLNVFHVHLPPLRERSDDVSLLAHHFVEEFNERHGTSVEGFAPETLEAIEGYSWPGNVRELRNVVERGVVLGKEGRIEKSHLPLFLREPGVRPMEVLELPMGITVAEAEKELILKTLRQTGNNKAEAARWLGVDVKTIRNKLKSYGMA